MQESHIVTYIVNPKTNRVHKAIDGKTHENCNVDQLTRRVILTQEQFDAFGSKYVRCVRCFRLGR